MRLGTVGLDTKHLGRVLAAMFLAAVLALGAGSEAGASAGQAAKPPKGPKIDTTKPCTLLSQRKVAKQFEPQVTLDATNNESPISLDCAWIVGDVAAPEGRLVAFVVYPTLGGPPELDAVDIVESDRANAQIAGPGVVDLPLGKGGFIHKPRSLVEVAASKKFAFSLQWFPTGGPPEGSPITDEIRSLLTTLATDVAKRGKQVG